MTFSLSDNPPIAAVPDGGIGEPQPVPQTQPHQYKYESIPGFFIQTGPKPKHVLFEDLLTRSFGMIDEGEERWWNLRRDIKKLQEEAEEGVQYKVLFLGRHGQGWHNHAVDIIGVEAWETHWTFQNTNGTLTWGPDPPLTPLGISQAQAIQACWKSQIPLGAPVGKGLMKWYCSPLTRTGETLLHSFGDEVLAEVDAPEVWEDLREIIGSHTCDKRSSKTVIQERFPGFRIEKGFEEEDVLWTTEWRESDEEMQIRGRKALDRVFGDGGAQETYISITSHSAFFANLLVVLGHQPYPLATGEMIPVVVKATRMNSTGANGH